MPSRPPILDPSGPPDRSPRSGERVAKLLARAGVASRREVERMIAEGRVALNGIAIATPATVLATLDGVTVDGEGVAAPAPARLFAYHKPAGLLVTERDPRGRPTIYDRLPPGLPRVVPVGRLDLATEGLLLLTTDGELKRQLELPATGVERTYRARAYGPISQDQLEALIDGVEIEGVRYGPIDANLERRTGANTWIELTLTEGKNREVRRVLEYLGLQVGRLIRTRYGPFVLGDMPAGAVGELRGHDVATFRASLKGGRGGDKAMRVMAMPLPEAAPVERTPVADTPAGPSSTRPRPKQPDATGGTERAGARSSARAPSVRRDGKAPASSGRPRKGTSTADPAEAASSRSRRPALPRGGPSRGSSSGAPSNRADTDSPATPPRPPRPQRKPGWARPKPKPGGGRPTKR